MKMKTRLHCKMNLEELTNLVTIIAITGELIAISLHYCLPGRVIGLAFLSVAFAIALYVFYRYHIKHTHRRRKKLLHEKMTRVKHKIKRVKKKPIKVNFYEDELG